MKVQINISMLRDSKKTHTHTQWLGERKVSAETFHRHFTENVKRQIALSDRNTPTTTTTTEKKVQFNFAGILGIYLAMRTCQKQLSERTRQNKENSQTKKKRKDKTKRNPKAKQGKQTDSLHLEHLR